MRINSSGAGVLSCIIQNDFMLCLKICLFVVIDFYELCMSVVSIFFESQSSTKRNTFLIGKQSDQSVISSLTESQKQSVTN